MKRLIPIITVALMAITPFHALANDDLEDKISKSTDESIDKDDELGQKDYNINYLKMKAKSSAGGQGTSGDANMNSVVLGAGSNVSGDIIIIDESRGGKTNVSGD